jgi:hypothetical protein
LIYGHLIYEGSKISIVIIITPITHVNMNIVYLLNNTLSVYRMLVNSDKVQLLTHKHLLHTYAYTNTYKHIHTTSYKNYLSRYVSRFESYLIPTFLIMITGIRFASTFYSLFYYPYTSFLSQIANCNMQNTNKILIEIKIKKILLNHISIPQCYYKTIIV